MTPQAWAAEYSAGHSLAVSAKSDDNAQLTVDDETRLHGVIVSPSVAIGARTARFDSTLTARFDFSRYNEQRFDSDDQDLQGELEYRFERTRLGLTAGAKRDSSLTSELLDTGRIDNQADRKEAYSAGGSVLHQFNLRHAFSAEAGYRSVRYPADNLQDYQVTDGAVGWVYSYSERSQLVARVYGSRFDVDQPTPVVTDSYGVQLGLESSLSENLKLSLFGGRARVDTDYGVSGLTGQFTENTYLLNASLNYRTPRDQLGVSAISATDPSGDGVLIKSDRIQLDYRHRLAERSWLSSNLSLIQSESLDQRIENRREYVSLRLGYGYQVSELWTLSGNYRHQSQQRESTAGTAESDAVFVQLRYAARDSLWSR